MPANGAGGRQQAAASNVPAGYVVNEPKPIANPRGEGTYKMVGPKGQTVLVPFSDVRLAEDLHYQVVGDPADSKTDAGRYRRDAAVLAPSFLHSVETAFGVSIPQLKAEDLEREQHPVKYILEKGLGGPAYGIGKGLVQLAQHSYVSARDAIKEYHAGNIDAAIVDAVEAVPILGHGINVAAGQAPATTGSYWRDLGHVVTSGPTMGTLLATSLQAALAVEGLRAGVASALGPAAEGLGAGAADVGGTTAAMTEGAGADAATLPVDAAPPIDASPATEGTDATPTTPPADAGPATESTEPPSEGSDDDDDRGGGGASPAAPPVDAAATPAAADGSTFSSSFTRIVDALKESKLGQRAPDVLRGLVQTIFQDSPNLRFATPYGPMEMSAGEFFTQPAEVQDALKGSVIDPTSPGPQQGLEVSQQGSEGGGLVQAGVSAENTPVTTAAPEGQAASEGRPQSDAGTGTAVSDTPAANTPESPVQAAPETAATPEGQVATEGSPQQNAGAGAGAGNTPAANIPDAPATTDAGAAGASGGQITTEDSRPLRAYTAPADTPAPVKLVLRKLTPAERAFKKELEAAGHTVIQVPTGPYKTHDFLVDGEEMELKTVTASGSQSIKNAIGDASEQTAQGKIVIDARKSEATVESALLQCERADGHLKLKKGIEIKGRVTVLTKSGPVRY